MNTVRPVVYAENIFPGLDDVDLREDWSHTCKVLTGEENVIGTLEPSMQRMWVFRYQHFLVLEEMAQQMIDVLNLLSGSDGNSMTHAEFQPFFQKLTRLAESLRLPFEKFEAVNMEFVRRIRECFEREHSGYLGIRTGFLVITRENDLRKDSAHPLDELFELLFAFLSETMNGDLRFFESLFDLCKTLDAVTNLGVDANKHTSLAE